MPGIPWLTAAYYEGNQLHVQPSVNISLLPVAERIYSPSSVSGHITVTCRPCKIKGCLHELENQSSHITAIASFKASKTSTSQVRNRVHLSSSLLHCSMVLWGIQHTHCRVCRLANSYFCSDSTQRTLWYAVITRANTNSVSMLCRNTWVSSNKPKQLNLHRPLGRSIS